MDLQKEFKDLNLPTDASDEHDEGDKIIKDLEARLAQIKSQDAEVSSNNDIENTVAETDLDDESQQFENDDPGQQPLLERIQPFIIPICLTLFAVIFAAIFLYFFSKSRVQQTAGAIVNVGDAPKIETPAPAPVIKVEPLVCTDPQILNDAGDGCIDPPVVATTTPVVETAPNFENGTTTVVSVRFSFDKYNYDNYPRGIYLLQDQIFTGDYADFKILPTNRAFANDHFFGVDRNMVSLIGDCQYVVDNAQILVKDMKDSTDDQVYSAIKDRYFRGNIIRVMHSTKPHIVCGK